MDRSIIHLNIADFAVAVERMTDGRLKHRPVIIAPEGSARASVYDMSEEAYQFGVRKGMNLCRAIRLCEGARVLPPHPDRYERAMGALLKQALHYSPLIEPGEGDGHLFADVTGTSRLFGPPVDIAWRLHKQAKADLGLQLRPQVSQHRPRFHQRGQQRCGQAQSPQQISGPAAAAGIQHLAGGRDRVLADLLTGEPEMKEIGGHQ